MKITPLLMALALFACGEADEQSTPYGQLVQALGLGNGTGTGNRLGSPTSTGNGLGNTLSTVDPGTPQQPQPGANPAPSPGASCNSVCDKLAECGFGNTGADCTASCEENIAGAGAAGQAALDCIVNSGCAEIENCF